MSTIQRKSSFLMNKFTNYEEIDCPLPIFETNILGPHQKFSFEQNIIHFYNDKIITIPSHQYKTFYLNNVILTSQPAEYILFCAQHIVKFGLSYKMKHFLTNDSQPNITLFNFTNDMVTLAPNQLEIICCIVLTGYQNKI